MHQIKLNIDNLIHRAFKDADLDDRSANILERRFGLKDPEVFTLQKLGDEYNISRERIRQIEKYGQKKIKNELKRVVETEEVIKFTEDYLRFSGGIKRHDVLVDEFYSFFRPTSEQIIFGNEIRFIYETMEFPRFSQENELFYNFWYLEESFYQKMSFVQNDLMRRFKKIELFEKILWWVARRHEITEPIAINYLLPLKKIGIGPYGDIGLIDWEEVNPKTVRAKTYLELKRAGRPMHFKEIASLIQCHAATVHNELIKDKRFKLSSRGTYVLKK